MIGSLVKFSCEKRELYFPNLSQYEEFDNQVGLVTKYNKNEDGKEYVSVRWLKPVPYHNGFSKSSNFPLLSFVIISKKLN